MEALSEIISENSGPISAAVAVIAYLNKKTTPYEKLQMEIIRLREENAALRARVAQLDAVVEWALETLNAKEGTVWWAQQFHDELRRRARKKG